MEAEGAVIKPQLRCYGRRNRSKSRKEEVSSCTPAKVEEARANGKLEDDNRLEIQQASISSVDALAGQRPGEKGPVAGQGVDAQKEALERSSVADDIPIESEENAGKQVDIPSELRTSEERQTQAAEQKDVLCVQATEVLDEAVLSTSQKEALRFRNEEEQLVYEDDILSRADEIWQRQEAVELIKRIPPKGKEPTHAKTHWDYVLEEMSWLAKDFDKERKWKLSQAKRVALKASKSKSEVETKGLRRLKGEEQRIRRIASNISKEVRKFWMKIEKLVVYKHQLAVEERKKKALDKHLDFLLGQTERYSSMLAVNLSSVHEQVQESSTAQPEATGDLLEAPNDKDFVCNELEEEDDEATIEADEALITEDERKEELNALQRESELPLEELVRLYAKDRGEIHEETDDEASGGSESEVATDKEMDDGEYDPDAADALEEDDERTFEEEEKLAMAEGKNASSELEQLKLDSELPVEELLARYRSEQTDDKASQSNDNRDWTEEAKERMGEPSTSGRSSFLVMKGESKFAVGNLNMEQEAEVLANVARAAQQRGERMRRRAGLDRGQAVQEIGKTGRKELDDAAAAAQSAQPTGYTFSTTRVRTKLPFLLKHSLREYQHIGLDWLVTMYEKRLNGILADEMGLGKTIMTIALLAHLACEKGIWGPHLIVVPTSVMLNWETEFMKWCPAFKVLTYFGNAKERKVKRQGWSKANSFHVCITTYRLVIQDAKAFKRKKWKYLILDEAHLIKNWKSQRWQMLLNFNSKRRILLTGTPLQNDLMELWSLMHFLMPHVFQSHQEFRDWFSNPITGMIEGQEKVNQDVIDRLHNVLRPFILRRLKQDVEKQLPGKHEHVVPCRLSKRQRNLYEDFMASSDTQATLSSGNFLGLINVLMQLRKVCNHPDLFESRPIVSSFDMPGIELQFSSEVCRAAQKQLFTAVDLKVLNYLLANNEESWEPAELTELAAPGSLIEEIASTGDDSWNENDHVKSSQTIFEEIQAALAAQRLKQRKEKARQFGWLNTLRCSAHLIYGRGLRKATAVEHPAYDVHSLGSDPSRYLEFSSAILDMVKLPSTRCENMLDLLQAFVFVIPAARAPPPVVWCNRPQLSGFLLKPNIPTDHFMKMSELVSPLRPVIVRRQLFFPDRRLLQFDCGKLQELAVLLRRLKSEGHRALIFTQMTKMLDILESFINLYGYTYMRLDGSTKPEQRQILMQRFNTNPKIFLFILSTRSGGVGINLVGADTVIFYDSDWNPAMDQQAQDRCHRIGQTREVHIYRLVSESTIEENILKKANQKRFLDDLVIQSGGYNTEFFKKLDPMELLSGVNHSQVAKRAEQPLSIAEVDAALKSAEDEADYMAMKKVEQEEAADIQEFAEDVSVEDEECADELEDGKSSDAKVQTPEPEMGRPSVPELKEQDIHVQPALMEEEEMDMLADVKQLAAAAAASGRGSTYFEDQLKPIERYAIQFLDLWDPIIDTNALETQVTYEEREWELEQLEKLKEEQEAEIDEDDEPLLYESWNTSCADAAYRQQVEMLTQQQELLQAEWEAMQEEEVEDANGILESHDERQQNKKQKKKRLKSLVRSSSEERNLCSEEDAADAHYNDADDCDDADEGDEAEVLSSASEEEYDFQWQTPLRAPSQRKRKAPRLLGDEALENENKRFKDNRSQVLGVSRPRYSGKLTISMDVSPQVIMLEREKKLKGKEPPTDPWMPVEDSVLCAVAHEYGGNWQLASDALGGLPDGGVYRGRYRHPGKCRDRYRQLVIENVRTHSGDEKNVSSTALRVTEKDTKRMLEIVQRVPDKEMLLQRHFATVLRVKDSHSKGSSKPGKGFLSTVGQPRNLPFISLANLSQGCLRPPLRQASNKQGYALVAEALTQINQRDENTSCKPVKKNNRGELLCELSLSFPETEGFEDLAPVNVRIVDGSEAQGEATVPNSSAVRSLVCEDRFRSSAQMKPANWAASATSVVAAKASPPPSNVPVKRQQPPPSDAAKLHRAKQPKLQPKNGMVEIRPVELKTFFSPSQLKPVNLKKPVAPLFTSPGAATPTRIHHVTTRPSTSSSFQQGSLAKQPAGNNNISISVNSSSGGKAASYQQQQHQHQNQHQNQHQHHHHHHPQQQQQYPFAQYYSRGGSGAPVLRPEHHHRHQQAADLSSSLALGPASSAGSRKATNSNNTSSSSRKE